MTAKITTTGDKLPRIAVVGARVSRVEPSAVAAGLGAEPAGEAVVGHPAPLTLYALRAEMVRRLVSHGGRPRVEGTDQRVKIPISDQDWHALESLAGSLATKGFTPSPGQVACVLLNMALQSVSTPAADPSLVARLAQQLDLPAPARH